MLGATELGARSLDAFRGKVAVDGGVYGSDASERARARAVNGGVCGSDARKRESAHTHTHFYASPCL